MILRSLQFQSGMTFRLARYKYKTGPSSNTLQCANSTKKILKPKYCIINQYREISNTSCLFNTTDYKSNMMSEDWARVKEMFLRMPVEEKRLLYKCGENYTQAKKILNWQEYATENRYKLPALTERELSEKLSVDRELNRKVAFWRGDITSLEIDSIVNAANNSLMGGGGVDGAIHSAAGKHLVAECKTLNGCQTGEAKIAGGYKLPAKYVILTVGPRGEQPIKLESCYTYSLHLMKDHNLRTTAFPCISTGVYGYPNLNAAHVCLNSVRKFLEINRDKVDLVVFCLFLSTDVDIYERLLQKYFPVN